MQSMAPRPCFFMCSRARSVRYFFNRSQLMRCCQSNPAMPKFAVPMVSPELKPRGTAVGENSSRPIPVAEDNSAPNPSGQLASCPGSALRPAASIPAIAQASSRSDVSPEMPTAPIMSPTAVLISTPPGLVTMRPSLAAASMVKNCGVLAARAASVREPKPIAHPKSCWFEIIHLYGTESGWDRLQELVEAHEDAKARRQAFVERIAPAVRNIHAYWLTRCRPYSKIYQS